LAPPAERTAAGRYQEPTLFARMAARGERQQLIAVVAEESAAGDMHCPGVRMGGTGEGVIDLLLGSGL